MKYDFDKVINRKGTNSIKYDFAVEKGKPEDILPLWVADMDFQTAPCILEKLKSAAENGIFGYSDSKEDYFQAVSGWFRKHFDWEVDRSWLIKTPGVVFAIAMAVRAFTEEGDAVLIQQPVYHPFLASIKNNRRMPVNNPLKLVDGHYEIDFEDFERKAARHQVKLFILCSPHNPVGRVWREWELRRLGDICVKHGVRIVSDEIHGDFVYPGYRHMVLSSLSEEYAQITITCTAPSKTFNLAGLQASNIFIPNRELREKFRETIEAAGYGQINLMGMAACQAAYEGGEEWLSQLKAYLLENLNFVRGFLETRLPGVRLIEPEGTYLVWLDFRELSLSEEEREDLIVNKARLWLDSGGMFGPEGRGFERVNIACPRSILEKAFLQLERAVNH